LNAGAARPHLADVNYRLGSPQSIDVQVSRSLYNGTRVLARKQKCHHARNKGKNTYYDQFAS
jgi:hypothetical protein